MNRYPGVTPFSEEQENVFFGRDKDIDILSKLIILRKQVLLYGKSGTGKTSLLNAGILPMLKDKFMIFNVRFFVYSKNSHSPLRSIIDSINLQINNYSEFQSTLIDDITKNQTYEKTLWFYLKKIQLINNCKFLFVFDQFEELFSYPNDQIREFKNQLHEILYYDIPDQFLQLIADKPELEENKDLDDFYKNIDARAVFVIRTDKLSLLNDLSDKLIDIQKSFYELKPLNINQAKQAIINPAKEVTISGFDTKPFLFTDDAVEKIINSIVDAERQNIETTQLQIICRKIESIIKRRQLETKVETPITVQEDDLPEFEDVFFNFCVEIIYKTGKQERTLEFLNRHLIRHDQRISLDSRVCEDYIEVEVLHLLVNNHLLRTEKNSTNGVSYEISHDTLIEPIKKANQKLINENKNLTISLFKRKIGRKILTANLLIVLALVLLYLISGYTIQEFSYLLFLLIPVKIMSVAIILNKTSSGFTNDNRPINYLFKTVSYSTVYLETVIILFLLLAGSFNVIRFSELFASIGFVEVFYGAYLGIITPSFYGANGKGIANI